LSLSRALKTIYLQDHEGISHLENLDHPAFMQELIGYDPWKNPPQAYVDAYQGLDIDWIIGIPKHSIRLSAGESSRKAADDTVYTEWGMSGSGWREGHRFHDLESILAFDPIENAQGEMLVTREYNRKNIENRRLDQEWMGVSAIVSGIYYTTLFQFGIMIFDWEPFLSAAAREPKRFARVLEGFAEVSHRNLTEWANEEVDLLFMHDDIALEAGMVFKPDWYRKNLFPLYEYILEPLKSRKGLKIAFVSDGDYSLVLDDLVAVGFDGFVINSPRMDLEAIARKYGENVFLAGGIDTNILTFGKPGDVAKEVHNSLEKLRPARGFFLHSGGDLPHNIPLENIRAYFHATGRLD
jgi:hypothetical protein